MRHIFKWLSHPGLRAYSQAALKANAESTRYVHCVRENGGFSAWCRRVAVAQQFSCLDLQLCHCQESFSGESSHWAHSITWFGLSVAAAISAVATIAADSPLPSSLPSDPDRTAQKSERTADGLPVGFIEALREAIGSENVVLDDDERLSHAKQWNTCYPVKKLPAAVAYPGSTADVVAVVRLCSEHCVPLTPYAAGTSVEGHTTTPNGGISIDMTRMNKVLAIHPSDLDCVVQPGVGWMDLNATLAPLGLFFPLDPGPGATIGGMAATRCSGSLAVKYGTMRDNVLALKVVLADGSEIVTGTRARKSAAGYDLTRLLIGSEGTLGIITEVTLRLQHIPAHSAVAMCCFPSIKDAADAAIGAMQSGVPLSRVEMLDEVMMHAFNLANSYSYTERPTLMFELVGASQANVAEQVAVVQAVAQRHGGSGFLFAETEEEKRELWRARKEGVWAAYSLRPGTEPIITDVCVPLSRLADCISETKVELERSDLPAPILAHAGDGNFHVCIFVDPNSPEQIVEAKQLSDKITLRALAMNGTCTGEHGIGVGKKEYLRKELGDEAMRAMWAIKDAFDPKGILNPGKTLPPKSSSCT